MTFTTTEAARKLMHRFSEKELESALDETEKASAKDGV